MIREKLKILLLILTIFSFSLSCQNSDTHEILRSVDEPFDVSAEEYKILAVLLSKEDNKSFVVIDDPIDKSVGFNEDSFKDEFPSLNTDTVKNYFERNKLPVEIYTPPVDFTYEVITKSGNEKRLDESGQYYIFSRIGFSYDGKQAFVYFADNCKALCGEGAYYLLEKKTNTWQVVKKSIAWVS